MEMQYERLKFVTRMPIDYELIHEYVYSMISLDFSPVYVSVR